MKLNKFVAGAALVAALGLGSIATTQTAHAAEGYIYNNYDSGHVVGVWIHVKGGTSGWANHRKVDGNKWKWSYDTQGKDWKPDVGIGGTPQNWAINAKGHGYTSNQGWVDLNVAYAVPWGLKTYFKN